MAHNILGKAAPYGPARVRAPSGSRALDRGHPTAPFFRLLGKTAGQFGYLALLCLTVALTAPWIQSLRAENPVLDWAALWTPTVLLTLPTMFGVAVLAVTFDRIPLLQGGLGTGVFVLLWTLAGVAGLTSGSFPDPFGAGLLLYTLFECEILAEDI